MSRNISEEYVTSILRVREVSEQDTSADIYDTLLDCLLAYLSPEKLSFYYKTYNVGMESAVKYSISPYVLRGCETET
jgi:hypothetical protein